MGQGGSTPHNDGMDHNNPGAQQQQEGGAPNRSGNTSNEPSISGESTTAHLRRSRRLRNHLEHLSRIGNRLMPSSSAASPASSSNRLQNIRFRSRGPRWSNSRSPSPSSNGSSSRPVRSTSPRRRPFSTASRPLSVVDPDLGADMMDLSPAEHSAPPVSSVTDAATATTTTTTTTTGARRSRMSRVRSSLWQSFNTDSRFRRPRSSRPSSHHPNALDAIGGSQDGVDTDMPDLENLSSLNPPDSPSARQDRSSLNGTGSLLDEFDNPARVRPGEDQAAMLSRLLSVAAAATAASLVGNTEQAITEAQDVAGVNGGDGSFESFLRTLQNGRLAAALRNGGNELGGGAAASEPASLQETTMPPLNFFRMFRFGSTPGTNDENRDTAVDGVPGRMVPVIIVGIRSVTPRDTPDTDGNRPAPFFDALANLPVNHPTIGRHRGSRLNNNHRRASMGGTTGSNFIGFDSQRHQRTTSTPSTPLRHAPDRSPTPIPSSVSSDTPPGPNPPPSTPADPALSNYTGGDFSPPVSEPIDRGVAGNSRDLPPRRRLIRRLSSPDHVISASGSGSPSPRGSGSNNTGSRSGSGAVPGTSRRQPGNMETRSWIIYVLGGSYPENHPILTTPSLFTDNPTYEDMTLLSSLLGPAKPPVASREDVSLAGGIFDFGGEDTPMGVHFLEGDRCLICLCDYEKGEQCRQISKCQHVFHKECIDQWLTTGRNSCPLCRGQGVIEKEQPQENQPADTLPVDGTAAT